MEPYDGSPTAENSWQAMEAALHAGSASPLTSQIASKLKKHAGKKRLSSKRLRNLPRLEPGDGPPRQIRSPGQKNSIALPPSTPRSRRQASRSIQSSTQPKV